jgi:uncharacterized membrane protein
MSRLLEHMQVLGPFSLSDALAVGLILLASAGIGWAIENPPARWPSVTIIMQDYRRDWMVQFVTRQPRIFDATVIDSLRQGTAFFSSACLIAIGGGVALIGNADTLTRLAERLTLQTDMGDIQLRVLLVLLFLSNALLKFIWSNRLFGYCSIIMASVPNDPDDPLAPHRAAQAAELNITAAKSFNRGLRSIYFALAALGWLAGAFVLILATILCSAVLVRREFASHSREVMLQRDLP